MSIYHAVLLGVIQGLTEFLPVSSSGHLVLFQKIFGISEPALLFDTMLHVGTLAAVVVVLWKDIWAILRKLNQPLTVYLIIATIPTVIVALIFRKSLEKAFETGHFLGFAFLITSVLLAGAELLAKKGATSGNIAKNAANISWLDALIIGIMQAIAIIPGVSRSGATLSGALSRRLDRDFAARFSFLLSIPAILGAVVFQLKDLVKGDAPEAAGVTAPGGLTAAGGIGAAAMIAGTLSAAIVGFFAVRFMLKIVREKSLWGFAIYTGVLGLLVLLDQFVVGVVF
jgi:undecaprenyl-diphosphatase